MCLLTSYLCVGGQRANVARPSDSKYWQLYWTDAGKMVLITRIGQQNYNVPRDHSQGVTTPVGTRALRHMGVVINIDKDSVAFYLDGQLVVEDSLKGTIAEGWLKELDCMRDGPDNYAPLFGRPPGIWGPTGLEKKRSGRQNLCSLVYCV